MFKHNEESWREMWRVVVGEEDSEWVFLFCFREEGGKSLFSV